MSVYLLSPIGLGRVGGGGGEDGKDGERKRKAE